MNTKSAFSSICLCDTLGRLTLEKLSLQVIGLLRPLKSTAALPSPPTLGTLATNMTPVDEGALRLTEPAPELRKA